VKRKAGDSDLLQVFHLSGVPGGESTPHPQIPLALGGYPQDVGFIVVDN